MSMTTTTEPGITSPVQDPQDQRLARLITEDDVHSYVNQLTDDENLIRLKTGFAADLLDRAYGTGALAQIALILRHHRGRVKVTIRPVHESEVDHEQP